MAKRQRAQSGAGSVYPRRDRPGTWVAEVEVGGKRHRRQFASEKAARDGLEKLRVDAGAITSDEQESLRAWLTHWIDEVVPRHVIRERIQPKTAYYYKGIVRNQWLSSSLAAMPLAEIGSQDVLDALNEMRPGVSRTTVSHARAVLSAAYADAVHARRVQGNPVSAARLKGRPEPVRVDKLTLSRDFAKSISEAVYRSPDRAVVELMLNSGLRPAEALAIRWSDVTLRDPMEVRVRRAIKQVGGRWMIGDPKTTKSTRRVPLDASLGGIRDVLFQQRNRLEKQLGRKMQMDDLLFPSASGGMDNPVSLSRRFRALMTEAGISDFTPRDLRSLHLSLYYAKTGDIVLTSKRAGHSDVVTTLRRYVGVTTEKERSAAGAATLWERARRPGDSAGPDDGAEPGTPPNG